MKNIVWSAEDKKSEDSLDYDLCGKAHGKYVDVVQNSENLWSVLFDCMRVKESLLTRDEAKKWAENADLIAELSNNRHY